METGTVKFFNDTKGFGFIEPDNNSNGKDLFVHVSGLAPGVEINQNDKVTFDIGDGKKGPMAINVELA